MLSHRGVRRVKGTIPLSFSATTTHARLMNNVIKRKFIDDMCSCRYVYSLKDKIISESTERRTHHTHLTHSLYQQRNFIDFHPPPPCTHHHRASGREKFIGWNEKCLLSLSMCVLVCDFKG
jgi:hypothetical protein